MIYYYTLHGKTHYSLSHYKIKMLMEQNHIEGEPNSTPYHDFDFNNVDIVEHNIEWGG